MKTNSIKTENPVQLPESELVALVLSQLKGKILFPEQLAAAKKYLRQVNKKSAA